MLKMKVELPKFRRCCLCIPLRYGLLIWGYLKLITTILLFLFLMTSLKLDSHMEMVHIWYITFILFAIVVDIVFNIIFVTAAHLKNVKLFRIYYHYSIAELILLFLLMMYNIGHSIYNAIAYRDCPMIYIILMAGLVSLYIINFLLQFYFIRLIKSEIRKLEENATIKLVSVKLGNETTTCTVDPSAKEKEEQVKYDRLISNEE